MEQLGEISLILLKIWEITFSISKIGLEYPAVQRTLDRKKLSHESPWFHRDFSYLLSYFYICNWKDLSTFSMPFIRMIIINKKTNNAAPLLLKTHFYAVYLKKSSYRKSSQSNNEVQWPTKKSKMQAVW